MIRTRILVQQHVSADGHTVAQAKSVVVLPSTENNSLHSASDPPIESEQIVSAQVDANRSSSCSHAVARSVSRSIN